MSDEINKEEKNYAAVQPAMGWKEKYIVIPLVAVIAVSIIGYMTYKSSCLFKVRTTDGPNPRSACTTITTEIDSAKKQIRHLPSLSELKDFIDPLLFDKIHELGKLPTGKPYGEYYFIYYDSRDGITPDPEVRAVGAYPAPVSSRIKIYYRTTESGKFFVADGTKTQLPASLKYQSELDPQLWKPQ